MVLKNLIGKNYKRRYEIESEFPDNSVKYMKYLDSALRGVGLKLFGGKRRKTNKKINNRSRTKMSRKLD